MTASVSRGATRLTLGALGLVRALLRPLLGAAGAGRAVGYAYAVVTLVAYAFHEQYRRAALGLLWVLLTPVLFLAVYLPLSATLAGAAASPADRAAGALHVALGFLAWIAVVEGVQGGATSLVTNPDVVRNAPIPLSVLPCVRVGAALLRAAIGLSLLLALLALGLAPWPGQRLALLPVALAALGGLALGLALLISAVAAVFRDLLQIVPTLLLLWFFASPIVFLPRGLGEEYAALVRLNPVTPGVTLLRAAFNPAAPLEARDLWLAAGWAAASLLLGAAVFRLLSRRFADHV